MATTLEIANETQQKVQDKNKVYVDLKRKNQPSIQIGDKVLIATHILSKARHGMTSKFAPRRDGPYVVMEKKGSSTYTVASINEPDIPIATLHASAITPYEGQSTAPIYPKRKRGRPNNDSRNSNNLSDNTSQHSNIQHQRIRRVSNKANHSSQQHNMQHNDDNKNDNDEATNISQQHNVQPTYPRRSLRLQRDGQQ